MNKQFDCLPEEDRPYEKCIRYGVQALTNRELLAVILRTGAKGKHVLDLAGELLNLVPEREGFTGIRRLSMTELSSVHGIGKVKAVQLKCILEIAETDGERRSRRRDCIYFGRSCGRILYGRSAPQRTGSSSGPDAQSAGTVVKGDLPVSGNRECIGDLTQRDLSGSSVSQSGTDHSSAQPSKRRSAAEQRRSGSDQKSTGGRRTDRNHIDGSHYYRRSLLYQFSRKKLYVDTEKEGRIYHE